MRPNILITVDQLSENEVKGHGLTGNDSWLNIKIIDNGIGFDQNYSSEIIEVFQRLHTRTEYEGTDIGLSICKKIVQIHGGTISAKSIIGQGSTFTLTLPRS